MFSHKTFNADHVRFISSKHMRSLASEGEFLWGSSTTSLFLISPGPANESIMFIIIISESITVTAWLPSQSQRCRTVIEGFFFATTSRCYTKDRCSYSPLFTGLICRRKDETEITRIKNAGSCARLTQIYTNALLYICEPELPTDRAFGSTMPADSTIFTISSNLAYTYVAGVVVWI